MASIIGYIEQKEINWDEIRELTLYSEKVNQWTNYGPVQKMLENKINEYFPNKKVIMCASGTVALQTLIGMHNTLKFKKLFWIASSYGFASSNIGTTSTSGIKDCDESGILEFDKNRSYWKFTNGVILTDVFGTCKIINEFQEFCTNKKKILVIDSALSLDRERKDIFADEIVSFHHTKPWGFGEGGCICVDEDKVELIKAMLNFGLNEKNNKKLDRNYLMNGKISELSCAFILSRLNKMDEISKAYKEQYERIINLASFLGIGLLNRSYSTPASVPLIFDKTISNLDNPYVVLKKYYKPLADIIFEKHGEISNAEIIYNKIVNFPCHPGINALSDKDIINCLELVMKNND